MPAALKRNNESLYGESTRHVFYVATSDLLHLLTTYCKLTKGNRQCGMIESMKTPLFIRPLTENERSQVLLASERGERAPALASQLGCHRQTVLNIIHGFNTKALAVLQEESSRPHRLRTTFPD